MTADKALEALNERLRLDLRITVRGDELKGAFPDGEGRTGKGYLDAAECAECARAFDVLSATLQAAGAK